MAHTQSARTTSSVILVAAGRSTRLGGDRPAAVRKPFLVLDGRTVLEHACSAFDASAAVREIVVVAHEGDVATVRRMAESSRALAKVRAVVAGGESRTDSVRAGLAACSSGSDLVAVHDAARPLVTTEIVERALALAAVRGAALVAVPVTDTIKTSVDGEHAASTLDRSVLWCAQTPQVFNVELLKRLLARALDEDFRPTDDAALYERYVGPIPIALGSATNMKLTTVEDLPLLAAILRLRHGEMRS